MKIIDPRTAGRGLYELLHYLKVTYNDAFGLESVLFWTCVLSRTEAFEMGWGADIWSSSQHGEHPGRVGLHSTMQALHLNMQELHQLDSVSLQ